MKNKFNIFFKAVISASILFTSPAHAFFGIGDIVVDPTNLVQNTQSAISAVKNEINTASAYIKQIQMAIALAKSLESLKNISALVGIEKEFELFNDLKNTGQQLTGALDQSLRLTRGLEASHGASKLSWKDFVAARSATNQSANQSLLKQYSTITSAVQQIATRRQQIVAELQKVGGQTAALQSVGAGIDALIGQNQQMISTLAAEGTARLVQKNVEEATLQQGMDVISQRQIELQKALSNFK